MKKEQKARIKELERKGGDATLEELQELLELYYIRSMEFDKNCTLTFYGAMAWCIIILVFSVIKAVLGC